MLTTVKVVDMQVLDIAVVLTTQERLYRHSHVLMRYSGSAMLGSKSLRYGQAVVILHKRRHLSSGEGSVLSSS